MKTKDKLSLNVQHDYITLRTPNGNYTSSWGGAKASGNLAKNNVAFRKIDDYVHKTPRPEGKNFGYIMETLTNPEILSKLWPEWNDEVPVNNFKVGDVVKFRPTSFFVKKYPNGGVVKEVARKNVYIKTEKGVIGFDYQELTK